MLNNYLQTGEQKSCFGCAACVSFCPTEALTMQENEKGFSYPVIDEKKCIACRKCEMVCPWHITDEGNKTEIVYAVSHKDTEVLKSSQSGGFFTLLSDYVLKQGGAVYGAVIQKDFSVSYERAVTKEKRDKMRESKYVQCVISPAIHQSITDDLNAGMFVLFSGTPCYSYMAKKIWGDRNKFITVDFICHGVPSPKIWQDYISYRCNEIGSIAAVKFRNQRYLNRGVHTESLFDKNGEEYISNMYAAIFYSHLAHRENCFYCPFANEIRYTDFTMGDFWDENPLSDSKYGVSMLSVNSERGTGLFEKVKEDAHVESCVRSTRYKNQPCLYAPVKRPENTDDFWNDYRKLPLELFIKKYVGNDVIKKYHLEPSEGEAGFYLYKYKG